MASGRGRLIHADGDVYEGEWLNNKPHGKVLLTKRKQLGNLYSYGWIRVCGRLEGGLVEWLWKGNMARWN